MLSDPCVAGAHDVAVKTGKARRVFDVEDDEELSHLQHMVAGAAAGMTEHLFMFPIDTVKTRMQSYTAPRDFSGAGVWNATRVILDKGGLRALWRGAGAVAISAGPAHALYFAIYEACKRALGGSAKDVSPIAAGISGAVATVSLDTMMTPMDVVKQRMQLASRKAYPSVWKCIQNVYTNYGLSGFFAGYKPTLVMNIPFMAMYFAGYETAKSIILEWRGVSEEEFSAPSHCAAGAIAGTAAALITTPLDVVKTRLQTQGEVGARRYRGMWHALQSIKIEEGWRGLFRGVRPRILFNAPAAAVCWTTYEFCKHVMLPVAPPLQKVQSGEIHLSD